MKTSNLLQIAPTIATGWLSAMSRRIATIGILAASIAAASAGSFTTYCTNVVNPNGVAITDATGNMISYATFSSSVAQASTTNYAGVWDMEVPSGWNLHNNDVVTFTNSSGTILTLTHQTPTLNDDYVNQQTGNTTGGGVPSSGTIVMGGNNGSVTDPRSFIPSKPLVAVGVIQANRNDASRLGYLTVQYLDGTTNSTTAMPGNTENFHGLTADPTNPIVMFTVMNGGSSPTRWDDIAFIVAPPVVVLPLVVNVTASAANPVTWGNTNTLTASVSGGTSPYTYQWQTDGGSGTYTNIPSATGSTLSINTSNLTVKVDYLYRVVVTDSASASTNSPQAIVNTIVPNSALTNTAVMADAGTLIPAPGPFDQYQTNYTTGYQSSGLPNYYDNNSPPAGETFTTGTNSQGYVLNSLSVLYTGGAYSGLANRSYILRIYQISTYGTTAFPLAVLTTTNFTFTYGDWVNWSFSPITLASNTVYAYTIDVTDHNTWAGLGTVAYPSLSPAWYPGGSTCTVPAAGGAVAYGGGGGTNAGYNGVFVVGLLPSGAVVLVNNPIATPNPAYALSPAVLRGSALTTNFSSYTYQWLTDDGTGATPPNYITIPGATSTNLTVYPQDLNPGGADYVTNYYFVVNDTLGGSSATSSVVHLTVHAATVPLITDSTPANVFTFVGASQSYTVTENGTLPITNLWQFDNGGGYASLTGKTNTTLTLNNLQVADSGNYQIAATNAVGSSSSTPVALTVLAAPPAPDASQAYASAVVANNPAAYWRFNETANNPIYYADFAVQAYDYSGHNLNASYGYDMIIGASGPALSGFESTNTAVTCTVNDAHAYMKAPSLNLNTNTVTICMWINPTTEAHFIGLLTWVNGTDKAGFGFGGNDNGSGLTELGYTWNGNSSATWGYHSGLYPPLNQWSFVALTITPTSSTICLYYVDSSTTNLTKAVQTINNQNEAFSGGSIWIGSNENNASGAGVFNGSIDEVSVFTHSLSQNDLQNLFQKATGITLPVSAGFSGSPTNIFATQSVTFVDASSGATNWLWNFGDGNTLNTNNNNNVIHTYAAAGTYTVSLMVTGPGGTASVTNTAYIVVQPKPTIGSVKMVAGSFVLSGTGGISGQQYRVLTSTNVELPLASWTTAATRTFAPDGSYGYTNSTPTNAANFYILVSP